MLHGLLTAEVSTKLGGDINYTARKISCEFLRPVFTGDTVRAERVVISATPGRGHLKAALDFSCYNQYGKEVLRGKPDVNSVQN